MKTISKILRLTFLLSISSSLLMANAQLNDKISNEKIILKGDIISIDSLLAIFSKQTGVEFSFNSFKINLHKNINIPKTQKTLSLWLNTLDHTLSAHHKIVGNHIVFIEDHLTSAGKFSSKKKSAYSQKIKGDDKPGASPKMIHNNLSLSNNNNSQLTDVTSPNHSLDSVSTGSIPVSTHNVVTDSAILLSGKIQVEQKDTLALSSLNHIDSSYTINNRQFKKIRIQENTDKKNNIFVGGEISIPVTTLIADNKTVGLSVNLKGQHIFSKHIAATLSIGYNYYTGHITYYNGKTDRHFALLPVLIGAQYYLGNFYISFEAGYAIKMSKNVYSNVALSPTVGYMINKFDLALRLFAIPLLPSIPENTFLKRGGYSYAGLKLAYHLN